LLNILPTAKIMSVVWLLLITAFALWQFGKWGSLASSRPKRAISALVLILLFSAGYILLLREKTQVTQNPNIIKNYAHQALKESYQKNQITIVEFTADWCPNCKLVELQTINTDDFNNLLKEYKIKFIKADITAAGTEAEVLLKKLGGRSIPFLAIFGIEKEFFTPVCLQDIFSVKDIRAALESLKIKKAETVAPELKIDEIKFNSF
jgi:thiol:disulfide interchange protein DsbD